MERRKDQWAKVVCLLLVLVPMWMFAASRLHVELLGYESVDHYGTQWFYWFALRHLQIGETAGHSNLFFYPWGKDIYGHTGANLLDAYLAVPFRALLGPTLGYNLFVMVGLFLTGGAFYRFCQRFAQDRVALLAASLCFAFSPYVLYELVEGRPTQAILLFPVLFVDALWESGQKSGWKAPVFAGLWLALCGYQYWYYAFFGGMMALVHGLYLTMFPSEEGGPRTRIFGRHAVIALVSLLVCLPGALPLALAAMKSGEVPGLLDTDNWTLGDTPPVTVEGITIGMFLLQPFTAAAGFYIRDLDGTERFLPTLYPLPFMMAPALWFWWRNPGKLKRGPVLALVLTATLIGIGPMFVGWNFVLTNPSYVLLAKAIRFLRRLWWPGRAVAFVIIPLFPALAVALQQSAWRRWLAIGACTQMIIAENLANLAPLPTWTADIPAGYRCLKEGPEGAIIELPYAWTQAHLYYQTYHQRPIFGGMIEDNEVFAPTEITALRKTNTYLKRMLELARLETSTVEWTETDRQALKDLGYRFVVVQKDAFATSPDAIPAQVAVQHTRLRKLNRDLAEMMGRPVYSDERISIFAPWGDPVPCDISVNGVDKTQRMSPNVDPVARMGVDPNDRILSRLYGTAARRDGKNDDGSDAVGLPSKDGSTAAEPSPTEEAPATTTTPTPSEPSSP